MDIIETRNDLGIILAIDRSLDRTNAGDLDKALETHFADGKMDPIWLDISGIQSVDSAGLTIWLKWHRKGLRSGRRFALCHANEFHRKLLEITRLDQEILIFDHPRGKRVVPADGKSPTPGELLESV
jgi:anti-anti-sigma factor